MSTAGYVKLLLPPRQSRGKSHWGLVAIHERELLSVDTKCWGGWVVSGRARNNLSNHWGITECCLKAEETSKRCSSWAS